MSIQPDNETDFDFRQQLRNTILLLGGKKEVADLLAKSADLAVSQKDVEALRNNNCELTTLAKDRLANLGTIRVRKCGRR